VAGGKHRAADPKPYYAPADPTEGGDVEPQQALPPVPAPAPPAAPAAGSAAQVAVQAALAQVGDPYVWGAEGPNSFDCSGLMQYAYAQAGISLPRVSREQATVGVRVGNNDMQPGDLIFFYAPISHVGMYIGDGKMVHAPTPGQSVQVVSVSAMGTPAMVRRVA